MKMEISKNLEIKVMEILRKRLANQNCEHDSQKICEECYRQAMDGARKQLASMSKSDIAKIAKKIILGR